jgi:hypothetical protein
VNKLAEWLTLGIETLASSAPVVDQIWDDLDHIDPGWEWQDGTVAEAASIFDAARALIPADWLGVFRMSVTVQSTVGLPATPPDPGAIQPWTLFPPNFYLYSQRYFVSRAYEPHEYFRWMWDGNPWGDLPSRIRVSLVAERRLADRDVDEEFMNWVEFTLYARDYVGSVSLA